MSIKEEWNGRTIYLPDDMLADMDDEFLEVKLALRKNGVEEVEKNRHFYPLLVALGADALEGTDADKLQNQLSDLGIEY